MGLSTVVNQICIKCGDTFVRDRKLLDSLGVGILEDKVCAKCLKQIKEDDLKEEKDAQSQIEEIIKEDTKMAEELNEIKDIKPIKKNGTVKTTGKGSIRGTK